jgi:hypothetical protein
MKRILLDTLCLGVIALGATQLKAAETAETPYATCMRYCTAEGHSFTYCHGVCKELVTPTPSEPAPSDPDKAQ